MSDMQLNSDNVNLSNINNFNNIKIKEIEPTIKNINEYIFEGDLSIVIDELVNLIFKELNEGKDKKIIKQHILNYDHHKIILQEIYNWLLSNQINSNSIYLLGYFNYHGIETVFNKQKAIELYQKAAELENSVAQSDLANIYIHGKGVYKNYDLTFQLSKKLADKNYSSGINLLGYCYHRGIGTNVNKQKAFELY